MSLEEFNNAKSAAFRAAKYERVADLIDPSGQRWKWVASRRYWAAITIAPAEAPMFRNSKTMCENRNKRRKSFGYKDTYSMRERGWPTS